MKKARNYFYTIHTISGSFEIASPYKDDDGIIDEVISELHGLLYEVIKVTASNTGRLVWKNSRY